MAGVQRWSGCGRCVLEENKIWLETPEGGQEAWYIVEQTKLGGKDYLLVTDRPEGDGEAYILRDDSAPEEEQALYTWVEDEAELEALGRIFADLLEDIDLE